MTTPHTGFHYVPTSGPIPGKSVLDQTERAINELGGVINEASTSAQQGIDIANTALATATDALGTAQDALDAANSAALGVEEARQLALNAQSSADTANQATQIAQGTADTALEASGAAASQAGNAVTVATEAKDAAQTALETANLADGTARQALTIAESNTDSYQVEEETIDLDNYTEAGDKIYAVNEEILNAPVAPPLFLRVGVSSDELHFTQECWSEEKPEQKYSRSGLVTAVESEDGEEETVVAFSEWSVAGEVALSDALNGAKKAVDGVGASEWALGEIVRNGIIPWADTVDFPVNGLTMGFDGALYQALQPSGQGKIAGVQPVTNGDFWKSYTRVRLDGDVELYVRTDGSNNNIGGNDTAAGAFRDWDGVKAFILNHDFNGHNLSVKYGSGTHTKPILVDGAFTVGLPAVEIAGKNDLSSVLQDNGIDYYLLQSVRGANVTVKNFKSLITSSLGSYSFIARHEGRLSMLENFDFTCSNAGSYAADAHHGGYLYIYSGSMDLRGTWRYVFSADYMAYMQISNMTVRCNAIASHYLFVAARNSMISYEGPNIFTGSNSGAKYHVGYNCVLDTKGAGEAVIPGTNKTISSGGVFA